MDVYLEPFIEVLQLLWQGVKVFDSFQGATFNLRAMCSWSIHDFLAYGLFAGCVTKGLAGCPTCGPTTKSWYSKKSRKSFCGNQQYLPQTHPYQWAQNAFNEETKNKVMLVRVIASHTMKWGKERKVWLQGP
jgi:hypothetical protein